MSLAKGHFSVPSDKLMGGNNDAFQDKDNVDGHHKNGFNFENFMRNGLLAKRGLACPRTIKTGTTTVGMIFADGVVLGADTRSTGGNMVANKACFKVHYLQPNIFALGAGTAGDLEHVTRLMSSKLELHRLNTGKPAPVVSAIRMFKQMLYQHQGHIEAALIVGGYDEWGPRVASIAPHGSTMAMPYLTMGSGSIAAYSVLETYYKPDLGRKEAMELVADAVWAGIHNDLYSGSNIDLCVIQKGRETEVIRPYRKYQEEWVKKEQSYTEGVRGKTTVLDKKEYDIRYDVLDIGIKRIYEKKVEDKMDLA